MKTYEKNIIIFAVILGIILGFGIQQDLAVAQGIKETPVYTIWAVDDKGGDLYYYTLNENYDNPDNMTPTLEGKIEGVEGTKDIEAFTIDSDGVMWLINNHKSQSPRESTLYKIDPGQVDGDSNTPVTAVKVGQTGLRAESNNELTNLQFINADGQTDLYGITKRNKKIYKIDTQTGEAGFVATVNTGSTGFRRTDALTQGADGVVYLNETDQDKIYKFESFPGGKLIEVAEINGADKIEALTAHPNGFLYAGDGKSWYKIWPDEPDNNMPTWEKELDFSFGTEGMDFWFEMEKVKLDDDDFTDPQADGIILLTNSLGSLDDVANQDGNNINTQTVTKWLGTSQRVGNSYLGLRFHEFPTYDLEVISAKLQITNNRRNQWITSSGDVYAEKSENPGIFSQDTLPSDRVLTSAYGTYDKDERWNLGQVLSIDVTEPLQELVAEGLAGETVALVVKGTGKRWARLLFNYDDQEVVKLVIVVRQLIDPTADSDGDGLLDSLEDSGCTDPNDADSDGDGISDGVEDANKNGVADTGETDPCNPDTDSDSIPDGVEDADKNGSADAGETDPRDTDTDDDGITDGDEDENFNGMVDSGETDPRERDTDGDNIQDGTEMGYTLDLVGPDTNTAIFQPDLDTGSTTDPLICNFDDDGLNDGQEDKNHNGRVDAGESDPLIANHVMGSDVLAVDFGEGSGLYRYDSIHEWSRLTTSDPFNLVTVDIDDDSQAEVVVSVAGGIFIAEGCEWPRLTTSVPEEMIEYNGGLAVDFGDPSGIYSYDMATDWICLSTSDPLAMITADFDKDGKDELVVTFSNGLYLWDGNVWTQLTASIPEEVIEHDNGVVADLGEGSGLYRYDYANEWTLLTPSDALDMVTVDLDNDGWKELAVGFTNGVFVLGQDGAWTRLTTSELSEMMVCDNKLIVIFVVAKGIYQYDIVSEWTRYTTYYPVDMITADLNMDGTSELVVIFPNGLFVWDGTGWTRLTTSFAEGFIAY